MRLTYQKLEAYLQKARLLGFDVETKKNSIGETYYIVHQSPNNHVVLLPDDVSKTDTLIIMPHSNDRIKVIGGWGLRCTKSMFCGTVYDSIELIDLTEMDTSNITDMSDMFPFCRASKIEFGNFDTHRVKSMYNMFFRCRTKSLDLSSFDTSNVTEMGMMFSNCRAQSINLSSFNTNKVRGMSHMFTQCEAKFLDLRNFSSFKDVDTNEMFSSSSIQVLDVCMDASEIEEFTQKTGLKHLSTVVRNHPKQI